MGLIRVRIENGRQSTKNDYVLTNVSKYKTFAVVQENGRYIVGFSNGDLDVMNDLIVAFWSLETFETKQDAENYIKEMQNNTGSTTNETVVDVL